MTPNEFEELLNKTVQILGEDVRSTNKNHGANGQMLEDSRHKINRVPAVQKGKRPLRPQGAIC